MKSKKSRKGKKNVPRFVLPNPVVESKSRYFNASGLVPDTGGFHLVSAIGNGVLPTERIGGACRLTRVQINAQLTAATAAVNVTRIMVVYDPIPNGDYPPLIALLHTESTFGFITATMVNRFLVLSDNTYVTAGNADVSGRNTIHIKHDFEVDLPLTYNLGVAGTIADAVNGAVYIVSICDTDNGVTFDHVTKVTFLDV